MLEYSKISKYLYFSHFHHSCSGFTHEMGAYKRGEVSNLQADKYQKWLEIYQLKKCGRGYEITKAE